MEIFQSPNKNRELPARLTHEPRMEPHTNPTEPTEAWCPKCGHEVDAQCPVCWSFLLPKQEVDPLGIMQTADILRRVLVWSTEQKNTKFAIHCFMLAYGSADLDGVSMTDIAKQFSTTRANVSKVCREICETFRITPSRTMRREDAAANCKLTNSRPKTCSRYEADFKYEGTSHDLTKGQE